MAEQLPPAEPVFTFNPQTIIRCATTEYMSELKKRDIFLQNRLDAYESRIQAYIKTAPQAGSSTSQTGIANPFAPQGQPGTPGNPGTPGGPAQGQPGVPGTPGSQTPL